MAALDGTVKVPGLGEVKKKYLAVAGAAVAVIVGVGYYRKRQAAAAVPVTTTQTDSGAFPDTTPVGPGGSNGVTDQFGNPLPAQIVQSANPGISTNEDWLSEAESLNIGIPADSITQACARILGGLSVTSAQADIYHQIVGIIGPPPQGVQPIKLTSTPPPATTPKVTVTYPSAMHQLSVATNARMLEQRFSSPNATPTEIEVALRRTVADSRNAKYGPYYRSHKGMWPAQAAIWVTYVQKTTAAA